HRVDFNTTIVQWHEDQPRPRFQTEPGAHVNRDRDLILTRNRRRRHSLLLATRKSNLHGCDRPLKTERHTANMDRPQTTRLPRDAIARRTSRYPETQYPRVTPACMWHLPSSTLVYIARRRTGESPIGSRSHNLRCPVSNRHAAYHVEDTMHTRFDAKVALVTGGGSGIGQSTAIAFARAGATVVVAGRSERPLTRTFNHIHRFGGDASWLIADVTRD